MVTPAKFPTVTDLPVRRWNSVDLPVLGLPTSAIFTGAIWVEIGLRTIPRRGQIELHKVRCTFASALGI